MIINKVQPKAKQPNQNYYYPPPGYAWNPLKQYPRNANCFCGSGRKFKTCCVNLVLDCCLIEEAQKVRIDWDKIIAGKIRLELKASIVPGD